MADTIGTGVQDVATSTVSFGGAFTIEDADPGNDGASALNPTADGTYALSLAPGYIEGSVTTMKSGGVAVRIYISEDGTITGSTAATEGAASSDANRVFTITVSNALGDEGEVTLTQYRQLDHPIGSDPTPTDAGETGFTDDILLLPNGLVRLNFSATLEDGDGDVDEDSAFIDLGGNIGFQDHGPVANDDVDSIAAGGDTADGNVITGADTLTDGGGDDNAGADVPAVISGLSGSQTSDSDASGGFVAQGAYGKLTMQTDGSYVYERDDGAPGNAQDIFTYTLKDFDGDTDTATLTINISDDQPVLTAPPALQLDDDNAQGVTGNAGGPDDDAVSVPLSGTLSATGGDGDKDYFFHTTQSAPTGFTYNVTTGATTQTLQITQTSTGLVVTTITLTNESGAYTVVQNNPVKHASQDGQIGLDDSENNTADFNIALLARDADNDPSNVVNLVLNIDDDTPVLSTVAAGVGVTLDETSAGNPAVFPISGTSLTAAITATQAFGADGAAAANSLVYGLSIVGGSPELTALRTAAGDHLITLVQIDSNTVQGQYNGANVAFQIDIGTDGKVTLTQNVPLEHNDDGSSAAAHNDSLSLNGLVNATITITDSDGDSDSASAPIGNQLVFNDAGPSAAINETGAAVSSDETAGNQPDASDVSGPLAVFAGVDLKGVDPHMPSPQFATNVNPIVNSTGSTTGADGGAIAFSLTTSSAPNAGVNSGPEHDRRHEHLPVHRETESSSAGLARRPARRRAGRPPSLWQSTPAARSAWSNICRSSIQTRSARTSRSRSPTALCSPSSRSPTSTAILVRFRRRSAAASASRTMLRSSPARRTSISTMPAISRTAARSPSISARMVRWRPTMPSRA